MHTFHLESIFLFMVSNNENKRKKQDGDDDVDSCELWVMSYMCSERDKLEEAVTSLLSDNGLWFMI